MTAINHQLFIPVAETPSVPNSHLLKAVIIGAGQVGVACAYSMVIQNTVDELVITDLNRTKLEGEVMDLEQGLSFLQPTTIKAGELADCRDADVVIITAGARQRTGETRLELLQRNVEVFRTLIPEIVHYCRDAILLVVTNPVDIMTYVSLKLSGLPPSRVLGSGTVLDTARFRYLLAQKFNLDPRSLHAYIIGEHGDSEVAVWSKIFVGAANLQDIDPAWSPAGTPEHLLPIFEQVKRAAYEIIERKGATSSAIGLGVTQIVQAILRNQNRVMTLSGLVCDRYGLDDVCLSLPVVINRQGISRAINLVLTPNEEAQLQHSGQVLRRLLDQIHL